MRWWWRRGATAREEVRAALESSVARLEEVQDQMALVEELAAEIRRLREVNGFTAGFASALQERRG